MSGTMEVQERLRDSAKNFFDLTVAFANKGDYIKALQAQRAAYLDYAAAVADSDSALGKLIKTLDLFSKFGLTAFLPGAAGAAILLGILSGLIGVVTMLAGALQILGVGLNIIKLGFSAVWSVASTLGGFLWSLATTIVPALWSGLVTLVGFMWSGLVAVLSAAWSGVVALGTAIMA